MQGFFQMPHHDFSLPLDTLFNGMLVYPEASIPETLKYYEKP